MSDLVYLIDCDDVPSDAAVAVQVERGRYLVCRDGDAYRVTDELCPHAGGSLNGGRVCEGHLVCPVHSWPWDLQTGLSDPSMPMLRLKRYECTVREGKVYADLSSPIPPDCDIPWADDAS